MPGVDGEKTLLLDHVAGMFRDVVAGASVGSSGRVYTYTVHQVYRDRVPDEAIQKSIRTTGGAGGYVFSGPEIPAEPADISSRLLWRWVPVHVLMFLGFVDTTKPIDNSIARQLERLEDDIHMTMLAGVNVHQGGFSHRTEFVSAESVASLDTGMQGVEMTYRCRLCRTDSAP